MNTSERFVIGGENGNKLVINVEEEKSFLLSEFLKEGKKLCSLLTTANLRLVGSVIESSTEAWRICIKEKCGMYHLCNGGKE